MKLIRVRKLVSDRIWQALEPAVTAAKHSAAGAPADLSDRELSPSRPRAIGDGRASAHAM